MKHTDYVICIRRGGGEYALYDCEGAFEARDTKRALVEFLRLHGDSERLLRPVPLAVGGQAEAAVYRKATRNYVAHFDFICKEVAYPLTDRIRGKRYVRRSAPCEFQKRRELQGS